MRREWYPFPEFNPGPKGRVLITVDTAECGLMVEVAYWDGKWFHCPEGNDKVKAWRPLPRPYLESKEDK